MNGELVTWRPPSLRPAEIDFRFTPEEIRRIDLEKRAFLGPLEKP